MKNNNIIKLTVSTQGIIPACPKETKLSYAFQKSKNITDIVQLNDKITLMTLLDHARIGKQNNADHLFHFMNKDRTFITIDMSNTCLGI